MLLPRKWTSKNKIQKRQHAEYLSIKNIKELGEKTNSDCLMGILTCLQVADPCQACIPVPRVSTASTSSQHPLASLKRGHCTCNQGRSSYLLIPQLPQISEMTVLPGAYQYSTLEHRLKHSLPAESLVIATSAPSQLVGSKCDPPEILMLC